MMKKIKLSLIICMCLIFNGCFNYKDINRVLFMTSIIVDIDEDNNPILYMETFKPYRSATAGSEKGERIIYKGNAKTVFETIRDVGLSSSYKLNATQNKAIIFTEKAAAYGIDNFIDLFDRDQEFLVRQYIAIYEGDVERLLKSKFKSEEYIGIFLTDLMDNIETSSRAVELSINDYLNKREQPSRTCVLTVLKMNEDQINDLIGIDGGAVVKDDKMVDRLPKDKSQGYNFIIDKVKSGTLEVSNPEHDEKFVTLEIRNSKTKTKLSYDGNSVKLKKIIKVRTNFGETQDSINITDGEIYTIARRAERNIELSCKDVFNEYKQKNLDIFNVEKEFNIKYPHEKLNEVLKNTEIDVEVHVDIEGSSTKLNFK